MQVDRPAVLTQAALMHVKIMHKCVHLYNTHKSQWLFSSCLCCQDPAVLGKDQSVTLWLLQEVYALSLANKDILNFKTMNVGQIQINN